ncbi:MAG: hypothetical protein ACLR0U_09780 [Enterocloster clostridioformis]
MDALLTSLIGAGCRSTMGWHLDNRKNPVRYVGTPRQTEQAHDVRSVFNVAAILI